MTAKELAAIKTFPTHSMTDNDGNIIRENDSIVMFSGFEFQTFCEQLCKEQRELCADRCYEINMGIDETFAELVLNAPTPEL